MNVAEAVRRWGLSAMVQISTDKVVNWRRHGARRNGWPNSIARRSTWNPDTAPGRPRFMTVRFGNVLGSSGSLIPLFERELARGGPLTVTDPEMKRFFMTIREAVELTLTVPPMLSRRTSEDGEIFVLDMGEPIKVIDIARRMIRLAGFTQTTT